MREGVTSLERSDAVSVDDAFASSSSGGGGFGRDGRKSLRQVANELSTGEKVAFALVALPALPLIVCFAPLLAVRVCVSKNDEVDRDDGASRAGDVVRHAGATGGPEARPFPPANPRRFPPLRRAKGRARAAPRGSARAPPDLISAFIPPLSRTPPSVSPHFPSPHPAPQPHRRPEVRRVRGC